MATYQKTAYTCGGKGGDPMTDDERMLYIGIFLAILFIIAIVVIFYHYV